MNYPVYSYQRLIIYYLTSLSFCPTIVELVDSRLGIFNVSFNFREKSYFKISIGLYLRARDQATKVSKSAANMPFICFLFILAYRVEAHIKAF